jgi:hypothetical protein
MTDEVTKAYVFLQIANATMCAFRWSKEAAPSTLASCPKQESEIESVWSGLLCLFWFKCT